MATEVTQEPKKILDGAAWRPLEPFSFWPNFSSAIRGWGGEDPCPDPYYCFHTPYTDFRPGSVIFHVRLRAARATRGELALRVHAFRPSTGMDAVMVAGTRLPLDGVDGDLELSLRIAALPNVVYAIYGRFGELSDLQAEQVEVFAQEAGDDDADLYASDNLAQSQFGDVAIEQPSRIVACDPPTLAVPISQPFTTAQWDEAKIWAALPRAITEDKDPLWRWRVAYVYRVIDTYGMIAQGATGVVLSDRSRGLIDALNRRGCLVAATDPVALRGSYDFLVAIDDPDTPRSRMELEAHVLGLQRHILRGGIGVFMFGSNLGQRGAFSELPQGEDIKRLALHVLGHGSSIGQLCLPEPTLLPDMHALPFGLIVRR